MINDAEFRMRCVQQAILLHQKTPGVKTQDIIKCAQAVYAWVRDLEPELGASANGIGHRNSTSDSEGSNPSAPAINYPPRESMRDFFNRRACEQETQNAGDRTGGRQTNDPT